MKVSVIIEKDTDGYYAFCPDLPGCQSQGSTFEETDSNIREAIALYLETLSQDEICSLSSAAIYIHYWRLSQNKLPSPARPLLAQGPGFVSARSGTGGLGMTSPCRM